MRKTPESNKSQEKFANLLNAGISVEATRGTYNSSVSISSDQQDTGTLASFLSRRHGRLAGAHKELVASVASRSHVLKSWEQIAPCEGSAEGAYGRRNAASTRIPVPRSATEYHAFSARTALV